MSFGLRAAGCGLRAAGFELVVSAFGIPRDLVVSGFGSKLEARRFFHEHFRPYLRLEPELSSGAKATWAGTFE
jgi:hypothetical protein